MIRYNADVRVRLAEEDAAKAAAKLAGVIPATSPGQTGKVKSKGKGPKISAPAMATIERLPIDSDARRQLAEVCCGPISYLGQPTWYTKG